MLLHQVLHDEPRSAAALNDRIPRDLETICLKAMAKEPGRRYATARELADDLRRWLNGEAIRARPVGRVERAVRWVKRNPAVATCLAMIAGVLITATTVSTWFGLDARADETVAENAGNELVKKNTELEKSNAEISRQKTEVETRQDKLEQALAHTWLSPLVETPDPLNDAEIAALSKVAAHRQERLADRFVTEALGDRHGIRRLRARSALVLHAVVGLDPRKRRKWNGAWSVSWRRPLCRRSHGPTWRWRQRSWMA